MFRQHLGTADYAFLGMEPDTPLTWLNPARLPQLGARPQLGTEKTADSRKAPGLSARQAAAIVTELGVGEAYAYAVGEEPWRGNTMSTAYDEDTSQAEQITELMTWCADYGMKAGHLHRRQEWRW
ncbi:hypothetical protein [Streptomyces sp. NPDC056227]|uniref:hypothetical protein n=1 Tax=Streptomyces sp. NPDC056227 TaxID=3345753 RepID=UPI0035E1EECF